MKKYIIGCLLITLALAGCKKDFLEEKRDLTGVNEEVFKDAQMAKAYVGYVYRLFQPADNAITMVQYQTGNAGAYSDAYTRTTDEMAGQTDYNREWPTLAINTNQANPYFGQPLTASIANNTWTRLREINLFLDNIDKYGLIEVETKPLKGQMYFWRAYQYFELLKLYGGVPIVLTAQNPIVDDGDKVNEIPRSSSSETLDQIIKDLDLATSMLPARWPPTTDWGRITSAASAALKGRVLLTWASPLFNRTDDRARWQRSYDANVAAKALLDANGYGLFDIGGTADGKAWESMFIQTLENKEAVFVHAFNTVQADQTQRNNGWEQATRPKTILGGGSISPTKQIADAFPMKDGKMPGELGTYVYDPKKMYKNRDPRFLKTFAYNGAVWPYLGNPNFRLWTYSWYTTAAITTPNVFTEVGGNTSGFYVRKATNPAANNTTGTFEFSGTDYMDLRYAEVILNLAESAVGADKPTEGMDGLVKVRARAGIENKDGFYGLSAAAGNRDKLFGAIINERKIEFAYENKRFWDLRRWLLFNNDFGTCTRLGQTPINGTRRTSYWISVKNTNGTKYSGSADPLIKVGASAPVIDREPLTFPAGVANQEQYVDYLYDNYFNILERDNLESTTPANWTFKWYNQYYFFGINQTILQASPYMEQTNDWPSLTGGLGTFDPLK